MKIGKSLFMAFAGLRAFSSLILMVTSGPSMFEADTGVSWEVLTEQFPTVAAQFTGAQQASLSANLALALLGLTVFAFAFKKGERWAWYSMWILPASAVPGTIHLATSELQRGVAIFAVPLILIAVLGLALSYRAIFEKT